MRSTSSADEPLSYDLEPVSFQLFLDPARSVGYPPARDFRARHHQTCLHASLNGRILTRPFLPTSSRLLEQLFRDIEGNDPRGRDDVPGA